jgi:hypothetical protein
MNISDQIQMKGEINIRCVDSNGEFRWEHSQPNLIVNEGLEVMAAKIFDKASDTFTNVGPPDDTSLTQSGYAGNFHIAEIGVGTSLSPAIASQTYNGQLAIHGNAEGTRFDDTKIKIRSLNNLKIDNVKPENSFYFQANFNNTTNDTLKDSPNGVAVAINEVMLIAKNGDYLSPKPSVIDERKFIARTVLPVGFTKYESDSIAVTWKLQLGS